MSLVNLLADQETEEKSQLEAALAEAGGWLENADAVCDLWEDRGTNDPAIATMRGELLGAMAAVSRAQEQLPRLHKPSNSTEEPPTGEAVADP